MAGNTSKFLSYATDPFDLSGGRRKAKALKTSSAQAEHARASAEQELEAEKAAAEEEKKLAEEENKKKLVASNEESGRIAISNYLAKEGSQQTSRRRFLTGAK